MVDYDETFSLVGKITIIRTLFAIAFANKWCLHQMDVKKILLQGHLKEIVYMEPLCGFNFPYSNLVCKLHESLYDLKQAP